MRISKGAKRRAGKQARYNTLKQEGKGYYFGDARTQRETLSTGVARLNATWAAQGNPARVDAQPIILKVMRRIGKFYGLRNKYPNEATKAKEV